MKFKKATQSIDLIKKLNETSFNMHSPLLKHTHAIKKKIQPKHARCFAGAGKNKTSCLIISLFCCNETNICVSPIPICEKYDIKKVCSSSLKLE